MNFKPFNTSGTLQGYCIIKTAEKKVTSKGTKFLDMTLSDKSGEINGKLWDYKEESHSWIEPNKFVKVRGTLSVYNDVNQFKVEKIRPVVEADNVNIEDYVPSAPYPGAEMLSQINKTVSEFKDDELKLLVSTLLNENSEKLIYWPAAFRLHHALRGGLLFHTLSIVRLAQNVCDIYGFLNRDLLLAGAILHDIAKIGEFDTNETGVVSGYTVDGTLIGHIVRGAMMVEKTGEQLGISEKTRMLLEHMILSHHSEPEFGAAVRPMFPEAEVLAQLDMLDSRLFEIEQAVSGVKEDSFTPRQWALDNRKLYNHGQGNTDSGIKLM